MKGDFSRDTFDPKNHFARVLMQQGRVQTDADWNEQGAQVEYRFETEGTDVIGACGAPIHNAGFAITSDGKTLFISAGRMYVDGILVENETDALDYSKQPPLRNPPDIKTLLQKAQVATGLVYLDVWQRHVTALDAPQIREVALGGPDTTTRAQVVWQVKVLPVKSGGGDPAECEKLQAERASLAQTLQNLIQQGASPDEIQKLKDEIAALDKRIAVLCGDISCETQFAEWDVLTATPTGLLNARTSPLQPTDDKCQIPPSAGYTRLENQLYRVEIHHGGNFPTEPVTFKWSRDNGTVVTLIEKISGQQVTVRDVGPDDVLGFANGQFVEVIDDVLEWNGQPGQLIQITDVNTATRVITLASAPTLAFDATRHPKLRRWDSAGDVKIDATWQALEGGVQVQFAKGTYATGDYWLIPGRTVTGDIEWPRDPTNAPIPHPRRGIIHHYCRLALVSIANEQLAVTADCRKLFPPLTELPTGQAPPPVQAFHVAAISWRNDDLLDAQMLIKAGLEIKFDAPPNTRALNGGAFIVTIEPVNRNQAVAGGAPLRDVFVLDGTTEANPAEPTTVVWHINPALEKFLIQSQDSVPGQEPRVRVRLMGHKLWSRAGNQILYLDGQVFGQPGVRLDNQTPRTELIFKSGNGDKASDFESWFYLGATSAPPPL
jgi:hypothetical protein